MGATCSASSAAAYARAGFWYGAAGHYNDALRLNPRLRARLGARPPRANLRAAADQLEEGEARQARTSAAARRCATSRADLSARALSRLSSTRGSGDWDRAQARARGAPREPPDDTCCATTCSVRQPRSRSCAAARRTLGERPVQRHQPLEHRLQPLQSMPRGEQSLARGHGPQRCARPHACGTPSTHRRAAHGRREQAAHARSSRSRSRSIRIRAPGCTRT